MGSRGSAWSRLLTALWQALIALRFFIVRPSLGVATLTALRLKLTSATKITVPPPASFGMQPALSSIAFANAFSTSTT